MMLVVEATVLPSIPLVVTEKEWLGLHNNVRDLVWTVAAHAVG
jgi:hypothetical protein